jgi:hypothetical protein
MSEDYRMRSKNCILVKDDVGRAKATCYDLPHEAFAYGRAEPADLEGAREVTMHWAAHVPRPKPGENCQDFRKLNRMAAKANVANAIALKDFKKTKDVKLIPPAPMGAQPKVIPSDVIPSFAYGRKSRPSTPIGAVVGYQYAAEYEEALASNYDTYQGIADQNGAPQKVRLTKASRSLIATSRNKRDGFAQSEPKELFKLSKFKKVPSRLQLVPLNGNIGTSIGSRAQSMPLLT